MLETQLHIFIQCFSKWDPQELVKNSPAQALPKTSGTRSSGVENLKMGFTWKFILYLGRALQYMFKCEKVESTSEIHGQCDLSWNEG